MFSKIHGILGVMSPSYQVLARKYRPQTFADLMGQDVLVKTLTNAIESKRIPHAILLTGVRGVGKTTTARVIARSLNCVGADGKGQETVHPCGVCQPCVDILQERHLDVLEMDAASRTSVDDIRRLIESAHYKPASARYKIHIIDEVHMLTKQAFNALLKTLEEPPDHARFIFATTELQRIPDTIISRCVRFDLKRFDIPTLQALLEKTCTQEGVKFEPDALHRLAVAANGSARDAQSLLEQAINMGDRTVQESLVDTMLGYTGRKDIFELFDALLRGDAAKVLETLTRAYDNGADPKTILHHVSEVVHAVTLSKATPLAVKNLGYTTQEQKILKAWGETLSMPVLTRLWQVLVKGLEELSVTSLVKQGVDMVLLRACYLCDLPTVDRVLRHLSTAAPTNAQVVLVNEPSTVPSTTSSTTSSTQPAQKKNPALTSFPDIVALFDQHKEPLLKYELENHVRVQHFDAATFALQVDLHPEAKSGLTTKVQALLQQWTGQPWKVGRYVSASSSAQAYASSSASADSAPAGQVLTLREQKKQAQEHRIAQAKKTPLVREALKIFPDAIIKEVTERKSS